MTKIVKGFGEGGIWGPITSKFTERQASPDGHDGYDMTECRWRNFNTGKDRKYHRKYQVLRGVSDETMEMEVPMEVPNDLTNENVFS